MHVIYEGMFNYGETYNIRRLTLKDIERILLLQADAFHSLEKKDMLSTLSRKEYTHILSSHGLMLGVFVHGQLVAYRALLIPNIEDPEHLGYDIGLTEKELSTVIYQEISVVHPKYRGNGLQQTLARFIMKELTKQYQRYRYVCCTVAPFNIPSLKDKFRQKMTIVSLKEKYDHQLRYIFMKDLRSGRLNAWETIQSVDMSDITYQQYLLRHGWVGFDMKEQHNDYHVLYGKNE